MGGGPAGAGAPGDRPQPRAAAHAAVTRSHLDEIDAAPDARCRRAAAARGAYGGSPRSHAAATYRQCAAALSWAAGPESRTHASASASCTSVSVVGISTYPPSGGWRTATAAAAAISATAGPREAAGPGWVARTAAASAPADPAKGIHPVDCVALASLRDSGNDFLEYDGPSDEAGGITMPGDLVGWFKDAGFSKDANYTNFVFTKDVKNLVGASDRFAHGHSVCLFINSNMLGKAHEESWFPDHWVVLASPVTFADGKATFSVYTWGSLRTVAPRPNVLCENLYGYISSSPR